MSDPVRVWAPDARQVELVVGEARHEMRPAGSGWWQSPSPVLAHGTDYAFALDGAQPLPDPRSPWQPEGVHGRSRWVEHARFDWSDAGWSPPDLAGGVIYELHFGTFTAGGTFESAIERLDHLATLGVSYVELMPVNEFPGERGWGYDGVGLFAPHHAYGGPDGLKRFVDAAHGRGLAVLLDVVYNHFGPDGNYLPQFGPYLTERYHTPWGAAVNLDDAGSDEVRRFFVDNALMWLRDYHLDGLRIDAVHAFVDLSASHLLEQIAREVDVLEREVGRALVLIAESDLNDPRIVRPRAEHGYGMDAAWSDDFHHALHVTLTGESGGYYADFADGLPELARALEDVYAYAGRHSAFRGRVHGRDVEGLPRSSFLGYLQNHDQIGNRALGERSSALMSAEALKVAATLVLVGPFVPMLFQGEEWAATTPFQYFTDHQDPELAKAVSAGRTHEFESFGWTADQVPDPQDVATFERSRLDWSERETEPHVGLLEWHRSLIRLRRETPALRAGPPAEATYDEEARWLVVARPGSRVAVNLSDAERLIPLDGALPWRVALASAHGVAVEDESVRLPRMSAAILLSA
ncbi:MAG: malto-oligosyltrehalose trehalohydrolase [Chloroflexota bacterium]|nr:malto-oligosyltrehalose trehalohydrolase [Chloroflexota bacterium]